MSYNSTVNVSLYITLSIPMGPKHIVIERDSLQYFFSQQDDFQTGKDQNNYTSKPGTNMNTSQANELQAQRSAHSKAVTVKPVF